MRDDLSDDDFENEKSDDENSEDEVTQQVEQEGASGQMKNFFNTNNKNFFKLATNTSPDTQIINNTSQNYTKSDNNKKTVDTTNNDKSDYNI